MNQNRKRNITKAIAVGMSGMMLMTTVPVGAATKQVTKEENVYANLSSDGMVDDVYVVNEFNVKKNGTITDYGTYSTTRNLTSESKIKSENGIVTTSASKGKFDYQGTLDSADLPWLIDISYTLDGKDIAADELAGASGNLKIQMKLTENKNVDSTFFENYLLQVGMNIPSDKCKNLKGDGATIANNGDNKQVAFNVMAGQEKTLTLEADVTNFEMEAITFKGVPMAFDIDTDSLGVSEMTEKASQLSDGVSKLKSGASKLSSGGSALESGMSQYQSGMKTLEEGSASLSKATKALTKGTASYTNGVSQAAAGTSKLTDEKTGAVVQIDAALKKIRAGLVQMKTGLETMNTQGLTPMIQGIESQEENLETLSAAMNGAQSAMTKLESVSGEYTSETEALKKIIDATASTTSVTKSSQSTVNGEYKEDHRETSTEESVDENGNKVTTITNNIYQTKTDTTTVNNQKSTTADTSDLSNLYQRMKQNSSILSVILSGNDSTPGLSSVITQCSQGVTKVNTASADMKAGLKALQSELIQEGGAIDSVDALIQGIDQLQQSISGDGSSSLKTSLLSLNNGLLQLDSSSQSLTSGANQLKSGSAKLAGGANTLMTKTSTLKNGVSTLVSGNQSLETGISELDSKTSGIGDTVQDTIDEKVDELSGKNYKSVSFVSSKNKNVDAVQFVMKTDAIEIPEKQETKKTEKEKNWLEKIVELFR